MADEANEANEAREANGPEQAKQAAETNDANAATDREKEFTPATTFQKVVLGAVIVLLSVAVVVPWFYVFDTTQEMLQRETQVEWQAPAALVIRPGPPAFRYDSDSSALVYRGFVGQEDKAALAALATTTETDTLVTGDLASYWAALDELAYLSNENRSRYFVFLLILAGLSGMVGVQIRTIINFVGVTCFANKLDVKRWWPWYALRLPLGFLLGLLAILIIQAGIFVPEGSQPTGHIWWLAISLLVGFGAEDFGERLRYTSHALFGKGS